MNCSEGERWLSGADFAGDVAEIARDLIGRTLVVLAAEGECRAVVVETEAYGDATDPASHAAFRPGGRASIMSGEPGLLYVYGAYGMYPCLNIVSARCGDAGAVLIRGVWACGDSQPTFGPGRATKRLNVTLQDHAERIGNGRFSVSADRQHLPVQQTPRIGITRAVDRPWRFVANTRHMVSTP